MKTKSFQAYLEKRLSKKEIKKIEEQAKLEKDVLLSSGHKPIPSYKKNSHAQPVEKYAGIT